MSEDRDELERRFEGRAALEKLLLAAGSVADAEDVVGAFKEAVSQGVPAAVVIQALWEDEPRFESPKQARALFSNLLGLFDLVEAGAPIDLAAGSPGPGKRPPAPAPPPFAAEGPDDAFVEAAWRYFDDAPKDLLRLEHTFDNRHDALVSWLDEKGLSDDAFVLARQLVCEAFAMLELGGRPCPSLPALPTDAPADGPVAPTALLTWVDEGVFEAEQHDERPLPPADGERVRGLAKQAIAALWSAGAVRALR